MKGKKGPDKNERREQNQKVSENNFPHCEHSANKQNTEEGARKLEKVSWITTRSSEKLNLNKNEQQKSFKVKSRKSSYIFLKDSIRKKSVRIRITPYRQQKHNTNTLQKLSPTISKWAERY